MIFGVDGAWANVLGWPLPSFAALIGIGILVGFGIALAARGTLKAGALADVGLVALLAGILLARLEHILLNLPYFARVPAEMWEIRAGGLEWRGALLGGLLGAWAMARVRRLSLPRVFDALALAVPPVMFGGWWACMANGCGYGAEVANLSDYADVWVWEASGIYGIIAPRWRVQGIGMGAAALIWAVLLMMTWRGWASGRRMVWAVALTVLAMSALGALRGDMA